MFSIDSRNKIKINKGDTATFTVTLEDLDGDEVSGGVLTLTVKNGFSKEAINNTFIIEGSDTQDLEEGIYTYDISYLTPHGNTYTPVIESVFEILGVCR